MEKHVTEEFKDLNETPNNTNLTNIIDLVICIGGDGTILHANTLFPKSFPPVMSFNLGSLGFLTEFGLSQKNWIDSPENNFRSYSLLHSLLTHLFSCMDLFVEIERFEEHISSVFRGECYLTLRSRMSCKIMRKLKESQEWKEESEHVVLNELVVDKVQPFPSFQVFYF